MDGAQACLCASIEIVHHIVRRCCLSSIGTPASRVAQDLRKHIRIAIPKAQIALEHGADLAMLCEPALLEHCAELLQLLPVLV
jgi:hypothetical protein